MWGGPRSSTWLIDGFGPVQSERGGGRGRSRVIRGWARGVAPGRPYVTHNLALRFRVTKRAIYEPNVTQNWGWATSVTLGPLDRNRSETRAARQPAQAPELTG